MLFYIVFVLLGLVLWRNLNSRTKKECNAQDTRFKSIPMPFRYPVVGNLWELAIVSRKNRLRLIANYFAKYGPIFRLCGCILDVGVASSADFAQFLLSSNKFINKGNYYDFAKPWLGSGLITSRGEQWRKHRKMLTPAFHYSILNGVYDTVLHKSVILIKNLETETNAEWFDVAPYLSSHTLDVLAETAMNMNLNSHSGESMEFMKSIKRIVKLISNRAFNAFIQPEIIHRFSNNYKEQQECLRVLHGVSLNIIQKKMKERQEQKIEATESKDSNGKKKSLIEILLNLSDPVTGSLSVNEIKDDVNTFLFAGHDTVATALSWTLLLIGQHPEVQEKIVQELDEVFGNSNRRPDHDDLAQLRYLDCVFKESLRLYPPVPYIDRKITEDVVIGDYLIPAGVGLGLHIYHLHRSPEHFPNPNKFDPSNFDFENVQKRNPYAFIPFSAGARNCIGKRYATIVAKITLVQIFRNFEIKSLYSMEENPPIQDLLLTPEKGAKIKIRKRIKN